MKIFAIADLHLSFGVAKPMDVFGEHWVDHALKIATSWREQVGDDDLVLIAGDFSWAMRLPESEPDFAWLRALPGKKVLIRGNHDYWWDSLKKNQAFAGANIFFIHNNAIVFGEVAIAGTRLWNFPFVKWAQPLSGRANNSAPSRVASEPAIVDHEKICRNEVARLAMSLQKLPSSATRKICLTHFPPLSFTSHANELTAQIAAAGVHECLYGHLHGLDVSYAPAADCVIDNVRYRLIAADWLDFKVKLIAEV